MKPQAADAAPDISGSEQAKAAPANDRIAGENLLEGEGDQPEATRDMPGFMVTVSGREHLAVSNDVNSFLEEEDSPDHKDDPEATTPSRQIQYEVDSDIAERGDGGNTDTGLSDAVADIDMGQDTSAAFLEAPAKAIAEPEARADALPSDSASKAEAGER